VNKYEIEYKGKKYYQYGVHTSEAMEKFANRKIFGQDTLICNYSLKMFDADTRGVEWAKYLADNEHIVMVSKIN
jgi:hypothetical protein